MNTAIRLDAGRRHVEPWALKQTPFHARTAPLIVGQTWRRWSGYAAASAYDWTHEREYAAIRNAAALFDVSPLHKYMIRGRDAARLKAVAFGVFIAGSVGMLAGRLLQAAVSRRREHLADASAVQFTRNPGALQGAFVVMAAHSAGTRLTHENSADVAHMFFAGSDPAWASKMGGRWFATHPPIEERVRYYVTAA